MHQENEQDTNLCSDERLKAGLEVVDATVVELGHLIQQLLVLDLKIVPDRSKLLFGLQCGGEKRNRSLAVNIMFDLRWAKNFTALLI